MTVLFKTLFKILPALILVLKKVLFLQTLCNLNLANSESMKVNGKTNSS